MSSPQRIAVAAMLMALLAIGCASTAGAAGQPGRIGRVFGTAIDRNHATAAVDTVRDAA